jgi:predicted nucleotidyltransferase
MRSVAPALLPIFRSRLQADILAALLLGADREYSMTDLAARLHAPLSTVHDEAQRLTTAGLITQRNIGRSVILAANPRSRFTGPLAELLMLSWGPQHVIAEEFGALTDADRVVIFGSWAARYHQQPGPPPHDLDVLVIGQPARDAVYDAADRAEQRLGLPVNPVIRTTAAWNDQADPLLRQIQASPYLEVLAPDGDLSPADGGAGNG